MKLLSIEFIIELYNLIIKLKLSKKNKEDENIYLLFRDKFMKLCEYFILYKSRTKGGRTEIITKLLNLEDKFKNDIIEFIYSKIETNNNIKELASDMLKANLQLE
jgi:hypothetical protein